MTGNRAEIALHLMQVLAWPNPEGEIRDYYIPPWMHAKCAEVLKQVPREELEAELLKNYNLYPTGLLDFYDRN